MRTRSAFLHGRSRRSRLLTGVAGVTLAGLLSAVSATSASAATTRTTSAAGAAATSAATVSDTLWAGSVVPGTPAVSDSAAREVGVRFSSTVAGKVTGIRFYKGTGNTGTHTGSLWSASGSRLATVTFTNETSMGWQTATFSSPVSVSANVGYVASYFDPRGHYASDAGYFTGKSQVSGPLTAPVTTTKAPNGVYRTSSRSTFPNTGSGANYYVDVTFTPNGPTPLTVMPLGDSVTYGIGGSGGAGGYRIPLWDQLVTTDGDAIDFVGTQRSGALPDPDNEGHLGYQITDVTNNIDSWLKTGKPSVILLHLGTNDLNQGVSPAVAQTRLNTLLSKIYADIPTVTVVVAGIIQMQTASDQVTAYDALIPALVTKYSGMGKHIQFVDMSDTLDPAADYYDNLHPNQGGYDKMAAAWAPVLSQLYGASAAR